MRHITFVKDGWLYTNAIRKNGVLIFKAHGFYRWYVGDTRKTEEVVQDQQTEKAPAL